VLPGSGIEWKLEESARESARKEDTMRLLYIVTKGVDDPTLASVPLHIAANGSVELGQEVSVVLAGDATDLVIGDNAQRLEGLGVPPARDLFGKLRDHEVPVYV
jgi:predicted peroxiredoxin